MKNPNGSLVMCSKCNVRATFTRDAVCSTCRNAGKKDGGVDVVGR